jgi:hypothetical protein
MLRLHRYILEVGLRPLAWPFLCGALFILGACTNASGDKKGAFYSYMDAQGNMVTVSRDIQPDDGPTEESSARNSEATVLKKAVSVEEGNEDEGDVDDMSADGAPSTASPRYASNPNELWSLEDDSYITSDEFEDEATRKQRERFVSYPDETGRLVTHEVDMVEAKQAARASKEAGHDRGEHLLPEIDTITRWTSIGAGCCQKVLSGAVALTDGDEKPVNVMARPRGSIIVEHTHPAQAFRLDESVALIQLQSWKKKGYLYPQALFLDENGLPLARVAQIFTRQKEQTWAAQPYLIGEIPVEPEARWLVLFLNYAHLDSEGENIQDKGYLKFNEMELPLAIRGELVVRATSGAF